jgi:FtsZ-binding cell division protein ZapB
MEFNHGEVCPHCTARPTGSSWGEVYEDGSGRPIASDTDFECGTQELVLDSGFTIHYQSDECRARTAEQKLEQVEQDWAKDKMATQEKLKSALLRLDDVQARLDETRKSRETELAALTDCWEAEKRALQIKLERVKGDREAIIQDVRNAEANTEQFRRQAEELGKAAADEAQGRIRILENLARIRDSVRSGRPLEWAYDELLALLVQERVYEPLAQEKISGPVYMAGRLELSESTKDWLREQFAKVRPMTGEDQAEADEVRRLWREQAGSLGEGPGVKIGEVPADRAAWRAVRIVSIDGSDGGGPQSPESLATQTPENPMSPQQVIAQAIGLLKLLAWLTPFQIDDVAARFLEANQNAEWLTALVSRILPATDPETLERQSLAYEPEMIEALAIFNKQAGKPALAGGGQILTLILQVIALIKAGKAALPAVPAGT